MLDPGNILDEQIVGTVATGNLPALTDVQKNFGYVPDVSQLRPGDLLLTRTSKFDLGAVGIELTQRLQNPATAQWTHAAIYAGDWRVFEATPNSNVASANIVSWMPHTKIMARRPAAFAEMSEADALVVGLRLVVEAALLQSNASYGKSAAGMIPLRLFWRGKNKGPAISETANASIICSGLYVKCFSLSTGAQLLPLEMLRTDEPITPALLAGIDTLQTLNIGWNKLV